MNNVYCDNFYSNSLVANSPTLLNQGGQLFSVTYVGGIGLMADLGESVKLDGIGAGDFTPSAPLNWVTATPLAKGHTFLLLSNKPSMMNVLMAFRIADITPDNTVTLEFGIVNYMTHSRQGGDNSVIEVGSAWTVLSQGKCVKQTLSASCDSQ